MDNIELARSVVSDIANKQAVEAGNKVDDILGSRVMDALAMKKLEVARAMFNNGAVDTDSVADDQQPEEDTSDQEDASEDDLSDEQPIEDEETDENSETNT